MPRIVNVRKPTLAEFRQLNRLIEQAPTPRQQRKAHALVLHYTGMNARDIATALGVHPNTIYDDLQAFGRRGWASIQEITPRGAPAHFRPGQIQEVRRIAESDPVDFGEPYGHWSLATLRTYLIRHHIVRNISREHLRQLLKKGASAAAPSNANGSAPIRSDRQFWPEFGRFGGICHPAVTCCSLTSSR
jgi:transposase